MGDGGLGWIDDGAMTFAGWRRLTEFACGGAEEGDGRGWGLGGQVRAGGGFMGSWLFHTSQCKALQVCSGRARELGTGSSAGSFS